jgi:DNA mismatch endonuclease (patch repair protein)
MRAAVTVRNPRRSNQPVGRSENMRRIRSRDTKPELLLRHALHKRGLRYRIHVPGLPGKPDIVFGKKRLAVFVHGCFWHQHAGCRQASSPRSNSAYWKPKLARNAERDRQHAEDLIALGYGVLILWECEIEKKPDEAANLVIAALAPSAIRERPLQDTASRGARPCAH